VKSTVLNYIRYHYQCFFLFDRTFLIETNGRKRRKQITEVNLPNFLARSLSFKSNQLLKETSYPRNTNLKSNWDTQKFICHVTGVFNFIHDNNGACHSHDRYNHYHRLRPSRVQRAVHFVCLHERRN